MCHCRQIGFLNKALSGSQIGFDVGLLIEMTSQLAVVLDWLVPVSLDRAHQDLMQGCRGHGILYAMRDTQTSPIFCFLSTKLHNMGILS